MNCEEKFCKWIDQNMGKNHDMVHSIFDTMDTLVVVIDQDGKIALFNKGCEQSTGYVAYEVLGKPIWELLLPEEREEVKKIFESLVAGAAPSRHENYWVAKDGSKKLISWSNSFLKDGDGGVKYVLATGIDITKTRENETRSLLAEKKYRDLIENTPMCIKEFDANRKLVFINKGGRVEHFIKDDQDISKWDWVNTIKQKYKETAVKAFDEAFNGKSSYLEFEHTPEGSTHEWCASVLSPIRDDSGKISSVLFYSTDITGLKKSEELAKQNEKMFKALLDNTNLCIKWFDKNGKLLSINQHGREEHYLTNLSDEQIKKWDYIECVKEEYRDQVKKSMQMALGGVGSSFEMEHVPGTSSSHYCLSSFVPVKGDNGEILYVLFLSRDITDLKKSAEQMEERRAALEEKNEELQKYQELSVGRELKMIELKKKIQELEGGLNSSTK